MTSLDKKAVERMKSITIKDGVMLHYIEDTKFKTTTLGVYVHRPLCAQDASKNALLPMVLRRGSERYPTFTDIERRLCDLCGAVLDTGVTKKGEDEILCFNISTISDQYYTGEDNILVSCADLLFDLLLHPKTEHGVFTEAYVGSEKENLCDMIDALVNDKQSYALWRLYEVMCAGEAYGVHEYGTREAAEQITAAELWSYYQTLLQTSRIDIFVCGSADIDAFAQKAQQAFAQIETSGAAYPATEQVRRVGEVKEVVDTFDTNQAKLSLGFRVTQETPYADLLVANSIWGSGPHSKLFNNVREKLSLAYYAFSRLERYKGTILVGMGIEPQNKQKAFDETLLQLKTIQEGDISESEFTAAKAFLINLLQSQKDSQYAMIDFSLGALIRGGDGDIDALCERVNAVTMDDAVAAARAVALDTVYFLTSRGGAQMQE